MSSFRNWMVILQNNLWELLVLSWSTFTLQVIFQLCFCLKHFTKIVRLLLVALSINGFSCDVMDVSAYLCLSDRLALGMQSCKMLCLPAHLEQEWNVVTVCLLIDHIKGYTKPWQIHIFRYITKVTIKNSDNKRHLHGIQAFSVSRSLG